MCLHKLLYEESGIRLLAGATRATAQRSGFENFRYTAFSLLFAAKH